MDFNQYQKEALATSICPLIGHPIVYPVMGLCGEAGETMEKVKKAFRDHEGQMDSGYSHAIIRELGDVLWYMAVAANALGYTLEEVAEINLQKVQARRFTEQIHGDGDDR